MTTLSEDIKKYLDQLPTHYSVREAVQRWYNRAVAMESTLGECEDYFDNRADADCEGDPARYVPNEEMRLLVAVREVSS